MYVCTYLHAYIYIHTYICMYVYIYIYIYKIFPTGGMDSEYASSPNQPKICSSPPPLTHLEKSPPSRLLTHQIFLLNQSRKDKKLRWPWSDPVVLNLCINLVITKYKLKSQYVKRDQLWLLTVNPRPTDYTIETSVLFQIRFNNISIYVLSIIFKSFH